MKVMNNASKLVSASGSPTLQIQTQASASGSAMIIVRGTRPILEGTFRVDFSGGVKVPHTLEEVSLLQGNKVLARVSARDTTGTGAPALREAGRGEQGHAFAIDAAKTQLEGGETGLTLRGQIRLADGTRRRVSVPAPIGVSLIDLGA